MLQLIKFLISYEVLFYIIGGVLEIVFIHRLLSALAEWHSSVFGLEKEVAQRQFTNSLTVVILVGLFMLSEFVLATFAPAKVAGLNPIATPTVDLSATNTPELSTTEAANPTTAPDLSQVSATATMEGCIPGQIEWTNPKAGDAISGSIELEGTVNVSGLGYYKFEFRQVGQTDWTTIAGNSVPVVDGSLGANWDTTQYPAGDYQLQLVVTDNQGNASFPACVISVQILSQ
ncbi:MAG TPA: hypothetical protein VMC62_05880 [Longilinea sp.]|nr:hypothetical protein [Longilinea sp.]